MLRNSAFAQPPGHLTFVFSQVVLHCFSFDESLESLSKQLGTQNFDFEGGCEKGKHKWSERLKMIWRVICYVAVKQKY